MKYQKGSTILTTPIIIAVGMMFTSILIVTAVKIISPYIVYERLSSICMKYVFVIEEYGYLTKKEGERLIRELEKQGFEKNQLKINYTSKKVNYGDEIFLMVDYQYLLKLPITGTQTIPMKVEKYSICKR